MSNARAPKSGQEVAREMSPHAADATCETTPWHIWQHEVWVIALRRSDAMVPLAECAETRARLQRWYRAGEPCWLAADGLLQLARGRAVAAVEEAAKRVLHASIWQREAPSC